ncbi:hypothetical protein TNCV_4612851 [Trichonephila clavipes]|nr:hypothetical protein TNCV_4612851 [Trichonephila clavipes]
MSRKTAPVDFRFWNPDLMYSTTRSSWCDVESPARKPCCWGISWKNRERGKKEKGEREKEGKRARKRQGLVVLGSGRGESQSFLFGDADQESETRMSKNALRTGRRQAVDISNSPDGTEDDYLFMEESNSDGENDTDFDDVPEDITEDEYADLFMLSNNESS